MATTTIRFNNRKTARQFARAMRRAGFEASQDDIDVTVHARRVEVERALRRWALRRGSLPTYVVMDW